MSTLNTAQRALLERLAPMNGIIFVRGAEGETALSLASTPLVALGPDEPGGSIAVAITDEGRALLARD